MAALAGRCSASTGGHLTDVFADEEKGAICGLLFPNLYSCFITNDLGPPTAI